MADGRVEQSPIVLRDPLNWRNFKWLCPSWLAPASVRDLFDSLELNFKKVYADHPGLVPSTPYDTLSFWIEVNFEENDVQLNFPPDNYDPENVGEDIESLTAWESLGCIIFHTSSPYSADHQIRIPINPLLRGHDVIENTHSLYIHGFEQTDAYIGITKRKWFERLSQHVASARGGSQCLFHRKLRETKLGGSRVIMAGLSYEAAMTLEEELVEESTLYPLGLNMIPGGYAGIRYLGSLGVRVRDVAERDEFVERISSQSTLNGRPNPLCASRWASDPAFAESVICGHSNRLSGQQVRDIRRLASQGVSYRRIADIVQPPRFHQIASVASDRRYSKVRG